MRTAFVVALFLALSAGIGCGVTPTGAQTTGDPPQSWKRFYGVGFSACVPEGSKFELKDKTVMRSPSTSGKENVLRNYYGTGNPDTPEQTNFEIMTFSVTPELATEMERDKAASWAKNMHLYAGLFSMVGLRLDLDPITDYPVIEGEGKQATWTVTSLRGETYRGFVRMVVKGEWLFIMLVENKVMTGTDHPSVKPYIDGLRID